MFGDGEVGGMTNEMHDPAEIALGGVIEPIGHVLGAQAGRIKRKGKINAFHNGAKLGDSGGLGVIPRKGQHIAW